MSANSSTDAGPVQPPIVIKKYANEATNIPLILGGDMNTPSHLDWAASTQAQHQELVVPWYATKILEEIGLIDTYRSLHPNPVTHPGITWNVEGKKERKILIIK